MKCHSDGVIHHTSSPDNIFIGLAFIPFKTGIFSIKIRWIREKQKSYSTPYYKCYGNEPYYCGRTIYQLLNYVKSYAKIR